MNTIIKAILPLFIFIALISCKKLPDFSETPRIEFVGFTVNRGLLDTATSFSYYDEVIVRIHFEDKDGDLGMSEQDKINNPNSFNHIMIPFLKKNGVYDTLRDPSNKAYIYKSQFQQLSPEYEVGPIEGVLSNHRDFLYNQFTSQDDTLKFKIWIVDRAGHMSNAIMTDSVVVYQ